MFEGAKISDFALPEFDTTIGLLGYVYNVYDPVSYTHLTLILHKPERLFTAYGIMRKARLTM